MTDWVEQWMDAASAGDAGRALRSLTVDAELVSPITDRFTFRGNAEIGPLLTSVFDVFTGIRFTAQLRSGDRAALFGEGMVGTRRLQEAQHLELDADGRIARLTLMMRPLPAVTAFIRRLGPLAARRQGRAGTARVLTAAGAKQGSDASPGVSPFQPMARP